MFLLMAFACPSTPSSSSDPTDGDSGAETFTPTGSVGDTETVTVSTTGDTATAPTVPLPTPCGTLVKAEAVDGDDLETAGAVAIDPRGGQVAAFSFSDQIWLGPFEFVADAGTSTVVAQYLSDDTVDWAVHLASSERVEVNDLAVDEDGAVALVGGAQGDAVFAPSTPEEITVVEPGSFGYAARLDPDGEPLWVSTFRGPVSVQLRAAVMLADGSVVIAGSAWALGDLTVTANASTTVYTGSGTDNTAFVARLDGADGSVVWVEMIEFPGNADLSGLAVDPATGDLLAVGRAYPLGVVSETMTFPGPSAVQIDIFTEDVFLAKWGADGGVTAVTVIRNAYGASVDVGAPDGPVVVGGILFAATTLGAGGTNQTVLDPGSAVAQGILAAYDLDLTFRWATQTGWAQHAGTDDVAALPDGGALMVGGFEGDLALGAAKAPTVILASGPGAWESYLAAYDANGLLRCAASVASSDLASVTRVAVASDGSATVVGQFKTEATIRATDAEEHLDANASFDAFRGILQF